MLLTRSMLDRAKTKNGAYTGLQMRLAGELVGSHKGWAKRLMCTEVTEYWWDEFQAARMVFKGGRRGGQKINSMSTKRDSTWNPQPRDIPATRRKGDGKGVASFTAVQAAKHLYKLICLERDYLELRAFLADYIEQQAKERI